METIENLIDTEFRNNQDPIRQWIWIIALILGSYKLFFWAYGILKFFIRHCLRGKQDLSLRYGKHTWAVVTGASDGIGAEFCRQLAVQGFNIALVSRTQSKLDAVEREIRQINPNIQTKTVQADFYNNANLKFYDDLFASLASLDVSILVNNVGVMKTGKLVELQLEDVKEQLDVNVVPMTILCKKFVNPMLKRGNRSAIINVSSTLGYVYSAGAQTYAATKGYVNFFTESLAYELRGRIDVQCLSPSLTSTNLAQNFKNLPLATPPKSVVAASLRDLGKEEATGGPLTQDAQIWPMMFANWLAPWAMQRFFLKWFELLGKKKE